MNELTDDALTEHKSQVMCSNLIKQSSVLDNWPNFDLSAEEFQLFDEALGFAGKFDFLCLVKACKRYEIYWTKKGVRIHSGDHSLIQSSVDPELLLITSISSRGQLLSSMHAVLHEASEYTKDIGSKLECQA